MSNKTPDLGPRGDFATSCIVDAPRERVFATYTDPAAIPHVWAPEGVVIPPESVELVPEPGGAFNMMMMVNDDADEAKAMGLVNEVVQPEALDSTVSGWCDEILRGSPQGLRLAKIAMNAATDQLYGSVNAGMELMALNHVHGPEPRAGISAFQEKRRPDWRTFRHGQGPEPA